MGKRGAAPPGGKVRRRDYSVGSCQLQQPAAASSHKQPGCASCKQPAASSSQPGAASSQLQPTAGRSQQPGAASSRCSQQPAASCKQPAARRRSARSAFRSWCSRRCKRPRCPHHARRAPHARSSGSSVSSGWQAAAVVVVTAAVAAVTAVAAGSRQQAPMIACSSSQASLLYAFASVGSAVGSAAPKPWPPHLSCLPRTLQPPRRT